MSLLKCITWTDGVLSASSQPSIRVRQFVENLLHEFRRQNISSSELEEIIRFSLELLFDVDDESESTLEKCALLLERSENQESSHSSVGHFLEEKIHCPDETWERHVTSSLGTADYLIPVNNRHLVLLANALYWVDRSIAHCIRRDIYLAFDAFSIAADVAFCAGFWAGSAGQDEIQAVNRSMVAQRAGLARGNKAGGPKEKGEKIRAIWASGKYTSRDVCAEQECSALNWSFSSARRALRNTSDVT